MLPRIVAPALALLFWIHATSSDPVELVSDSPIDLPRAQSIAALTHGPEHHFVGYYGIRPWNGDSTYLACLESGFGDRLVQSTDKAGICLIDRNTGKLTRIAETSAWNLQQGSMLHWLPSAPIHELVYNDRIDGKLVSIVLNIQDKSRRILPRPIAAISPDGKRGISINYDRLRRIRPVTGYAGNEHAKVPIINRPADDGLFLIDLTTGKNRLLISVEQACSAQAAPDFIAQQPFWLEHSMFSRGGTWIFLLARAFDPKTHQLVSLPLVISAAGNGLRPMLPWAIQGASHYDWLDDHRLVLTRQQPSGTWQHLMIDVNDLPARPRPLAPDILTRDGHCTFSPDGRWMITDTYPDENHRQHLYIYNVQTGRAARIASFHEPAQYKGDWRCDLHPRWSRDSKQVCIDSTHEGSRQVYLLDLKMPPGSN